MKEITIWEINGSMNAGGTESLIMEILRNCPKDIKIILIILGEEGKTKGIFDEEIQDLDIPVYFLPSVGSVGIKQFTKEFTKLVRRIGKPDVIHSHINAAGGFIARAAKKNDIEYRIVHCHAAISYQGTRLLLFKREIELFVMKMFVNEYANYYWACSQQAAERLFYKRKKYTVIPNVIDVRKYLTAPQYRDSERERLGITSTTIAVGTVGRIVPIKNYGIIIDAMDILKKRGVNVQFYCYGRIADDNYYRVLTQKVKEKGLSEVVHFLGDCNCVHKALGAFDVFVMPSISEGLSISSLEAQAAGLPTVLSTGIPDEVDMGLGLVKKIAPKDAESWADAIYESQLQKIAQEEILEAFCEKKYDSKTACNTIFNAYRQMKERETKDA